MSDLSISKWWHDEGPLSGTDDSLLLLDYFGESAADSDIDPVPFNLSQIVGELHLFPAEGETRGAWFGIADIDDHHFDNDDMVLLDLSGIILECAKRGSVALSDLDPGTAYESTIQILLDDPASLAHIVRGLRLFAAHPEASTLAEMLDADELMEHSDAATAIANELGAAPSPSAA